MQSIESRQKTMFNFSRTIVAIIAFISLQVFSNAQENTSTGEVIALEEIYSANRDNDVLNIASNYFFENIGTASHYSRRFHRRKTANGERFNMHHFTAAHKHLPFGTILRVTNLRNNKKVLVRVNDRGPYVKPRILDLSYKSAKTLKGTGLPKVKIEGLNGQSFAESSNRNKAKYFFLYSYSDSLKCMPHKTLEIIDSVKTFNKIVHKYNRYIDTAVYNKYFLIVEAGMKNKKESRKNANKYYIGTILPTPTQIQMIDNIAGI